MKLSRVCLNFNLANHPISQKQLNKERLIFVTYKVKFKTGIDVHTLSTFYSLLFDNLLDSF